VPKPIAGNQPPRSGGVGSQFIQLLYTEYGLLALDNQGAVWALRQIGGLDDVIHGTARWAWRPFTSRRESV